MESKIDKANKLGGAINNWTKILIGIVVLIVAIGGAWYQIQTNATDNLRQDGQFKQVLETMTSEFDMWGNRSDKRYQRAMNEADKLHTEDDHLHEEIDELRDQNLDLVKEIWYIKGRLDEQDRH